MYFFVVLCFYEPLWDDFHSSMDGLVPCSKMGSRWCYNQYRNKRISRLLDVGGFAGTYTLTIVSLGDLFISLLLHF